MDGAVEDPETAGDADAAADGAEGHRCEQAEPAKYGLTPSGRLSLSLDVPQHAGLRERVRMVRDALSRLPVLPE